ncbi:hypothetical protein [Pseudomonas sp. TWRC1-2]|uniref:hypothetical protein n=1 Tax=Pseudomonas sp. TWRC1-2 TaxID=2804628 RepID=UPI003CFA37B7
MPNFILDDESPCDLTFFLSPSKLILVHSDYGASGKHFTKQFDDGCWVPAIPFQICNRGEKEAALVLTPVNNLGHMAAQHLVRETGCYRPPNPLDILDVQTFRRSLSEVFNLLERHNLGPGYGQAWPPRCHCLSNNLIQNLLSALESSLRA